jgi:hypothetical protein
MTLRTIWELPQNILGFIVKKIYKAQFVAEYGDAHVYHWKHKKGHSMSLGKYIFLYRPSDIETLKHEYGHTVQSKYLGPLYLIVIGIMSAIWCNFFEGYRKKTGKSYYWFYTESWANKLGDVDK